MSGGRVCCNQEETAYEKLVVSGCSGLGLVLYLQPLLHFWRDQSLLVCCLQIPPLLYFIYLCTYREVERTSLILSSIAIWSPFLHWSFSRLKVLLYMTTARLCILPQWKSRCFFPSGFHAGIGALCVLVSASGLQCAGPGDKLAANQSRSVLFFYSDSLPVLHTDTDIHTQYAILSNAVPRPSCVRISISVQPAAVRATIICQIDMYLNWITSVG